MADPMEFDPERVLANVRSATTEDLLNRITVYRAGMEPQALRIIERELSERGLQADNIEEYWDGLRDEIILQADGIATRCSVCHHPAVWQGQDWHRLWGRFPVFRRHFYYCKHHKPPEPEEAAT